MSKFKIDRSIHGFAQGILEGDQVIIHLQEGTVFNEENIERVVYLLNVAHGILYNPYTKTADLSPPHRRDLRVDVDL